MVNASCIWHLYFSWHCDHFFFLENTHFLISNDSIPLWFLSESLNPPFISTQDHLLSPIFLEKPFNYDVLKVQLWITSPLTFLYWYHLIYSHNPGTIHSKNYKRCVTSISPKIKNFMYHHTMELWFRCSIIGKNDKIENFLFF